MIHPPIARSTLAALLILVTAGLASAQYNPFPRYNPPGVGNRVPPLPGSQNRPNLSPYLNLLRGGNPAANYYLGVVPEVQRRQNLQQIDASLQYLDTRVNTLQSEVGEEGGGLGQTGHPTPVLNLGPYYNSGRLPTQTPRQRTAPAGQQRTAPAGSPPGSTRPGSGK